MHAHAARLADGLAAPIGRQSLFIQRVAGFVQDAHERLREIILFIASGQAHVVGRAAAEGVGGNVQAPVVEIEPQRLHEPRGDSFLCCDGKGALRPNRCRAASLCLQNLGE